MDDESSLDSLEEMEDISDMKRKKQTTALGPQPPKRPRRKAASQPGPSSPARPPQPPQPSLGTSRRGDPRRERDGDQNISAGDMYEAIRSGKSAMVTVVDEWLDSYKKDREAGLLELINFIVRCCGCKGVVSRAMFDNDQHAEIIGTLTKEFNEDSVHYPLSSPGPQWRTFRAGLCEFVRVLVRSCQHSQLYDDYLFSSLLALLTGLSDSQVRAFRHTSTLLAMKLMTGVVEVVVVVSTQMKTSQRRYDVEQSKRAEDRAEERLEELQATIRELQEHIGELSAIMNSTFNGVFVHRYRDCVPEIRAACIEEMGVWMREDPEDFLNDGYLKYLGWTLNDKQISVRLQCVLALQGLYQEKDFIGRLELFTNRFKNRMLSMVLDKDPGMAMKTIQLLLLIQQGTEEGLTDEESKNVYPLVFACHRGLASAAGTFLYHKMCSHGAKDFLNLLVSFYIQSEFHDYGAYLVDSLWDVAEVELRDWETMTSLLLQEPGQGQGLEDEEEVALIELMMCAVRQASEGHPPPGRAQGKRILGKKDKKTQAQDRRRISTHFIPQLPQLLAKYSADTEKVSSLLKAPLYFDLETYSSAGRLEKFLDLLLSQLCGIVEKHVDSGVLEACARVACALCAESYTFSSRANLAISQLLDGLMERFSSHLSDLLRGFAEEDDVYSAAVALKRIAAFSGAKDLTALKLFEPCFQLLKSGVESGDFDKELMVPALKCAYFHLVWEKVRVSNSTPTKVELKRLKKEFHSFCVVCQSCLSVGQAEIRDQAFEQLCDLLLLLGVGAMSSQPALRTLAYPPSDSLRSEMAAFLLDYVFTEPEDDELLDFSEEEKAEELNICRLQRRRKQELNICRLQRRRNQLSGFCKLVFYGVLDLNAATDIFKYYSKFYKDYGDIIKETLSKTRLICPMESASTVCLTLQQMLAALAPEERGSEELGEIRELAKRLAMSFAVDLHSVRKPLITLHMSGIQFALRDAVKGEEPLNLPFLEILSEFSFKLLRQDRIQVSRFLRAELPSAAPSWPSLSMYQRSLGPAKSRGEEEKESPAPSPRSTPASTHRRTTPRGSAASSASGRGVWQDSGSIHSLPTPTLTSTVERRAPKPVARTPSKAARTPSKAAGLSSNLEPEPDEDDDDDDDDDFSQGSLQRIGRMELSRGRQASTVQPSPVECDLDSHLTLLSLIEEDEDEIEEEPEIDYFESDDSDRETSITLPSTRRSTTSYLEGLFE